MTDIPRPPWISAQSAPAEEPRGAFWKLLRCRLRQLRNTLDKHLREAPLRSLSVLGLLAIIWTVLYVLLALILRHVRSWGLVGVVADQQIFVHFFLVLAVMLAFSNGILTFATLYGKQEASHLLAMPVSPWQVVSMKWLEGMLLSSWSFLLLGVPLMLAIANQTTVEWYYYPLFLGQFLGFVAMPASVGLLGACGVALFAPRRPGMALLIAASVIIVPLSLWVIFMSRQAIESEQWLKVIFDNLTFARQPYLPSTWTAKGIEAAIEQRVGDSLFYLGVALANGAFITWLSVNILGLTWPVAFSRAQQGRFEPTIREGWISAGLCDALFFYLPVRLRRVVLKDLRSFTRDAKQWTQMVIMLGLLIMYVANLRRLPIDLQNPTMKSMIAFLNLTTVSLILATFTSRFVFPLLSLESQQLWLLGFLPVSRTQLLWTKFLFALTMTGISALGVMGLAVRVLSLQAALARLHMLVALGVCVGLSGLAIGLGARFPMRNQRNPAQIAAGFGGTLNLVASMIFVLSEMFAVAALTIGEFGEKFGVVRTFLAAPGVLIAGMLLLGVATAAIAMWVGARHFERLDV
ncbi:MAG: hypothetical protein U1D55_00810 [Phycisphaerae bacterium]